MSFQKLTALVALVVFASQGAMAAPYPFPPFPPTATPSVPQDIADNLSSISGNNIATAGVPILPSDMIKQGIKAGGGTIAPAYSSLYPSPPVAYVGPDLTDNAGKVIATDGAAILPSDLVDTAIKTAGGTVPRVEDVES